MAKITEFVKKYLFYIICAVVGLVAGYLVGQHFTEPVTIEKPPVIKTEYKTKTETQFVYVPKEPGEKTDIDANIGKQDLKVVVNGREAVIQKFDSEDYVLQQGKLELTQTSTAKLDINVPTIDKTKHYGAGPGWSNHGLSGMGTYPVIKKANLDGWVYGDKDTIATGMILRF